MKNGACASSAPLPQHPHTPRGRHTPVGRGEANPRGKGEGGVPSRLSISVPHPTRSRCTTCGSGGRETHPPRPSLSPPKRRTECPVPSKQKDETPRGRWRRRGQGSKRRRYDGPFIRRGRKPVAPSPTNRTEVESDRCQSYDESNRGRNEKKPIATRS